MLRKPGRTADFKLVALDVDGTVLNSNGEVTPELRQALAAVASRSVRVVLCTGRRWRTAYPLVRELGSVHPVVVCCGGCLIKRADDERTLYIDPMEHELARSAVTAFRRNGLVPMVLYDRPLSGQELKIGLCDRGHAERLPYIQANGGSYEWYTGDHPDTDERPLEVYTVDSVELVRAAEAHVRQDLGQGPVVEAMLQPRYGPGQLAVEVHGPSATKWGALEWLLGRWRISPERVVAVGDDVNDIPMLRAAGLSFAMGNALPEVKAAADEVTATNDEHGVAQALRKVFGL